MSETTHTNKSQKLLKTRNGILHQVEKVRGDGLGGVDANLVDATTKITVYSYHTHLARFPTSVTFFICIRIKKGENRGMEMSLYNYDKNGSFGSSNVNTHHVS